jgi:hypothetical protein
MISIWDGEQLPPVGCDVLIEHGRDDDDHVCTVTGYTIWPALSGKPTEHRIFVDLVYKDSTTKNQRMLCDVRPLHKPRKRDEQRTGTKASLGKKQEAA